jgi:hypothetical protein
MPREVISRQTAAMPGPATIIYEPKPEDVDDGHLRRLYQRWLAEIADGKGRAGEEILEYPELAPMIRSLMLLEIIPDPLGGYDYLYRVYGSDILRSYGIDMTGKRASDFPSGMFQFFSGIYETAINRKIVIHSLHPPPMNVNVKKWERLIFPLGEAEIKWLLVVNIPKGKRREA